MISQNRYVRIVSGVGAGANVAQRQLLLRVITANPVLPPGIIAEFGTLDAVGAYFGMQSEEYRRAQPYFSFISKSIKSPSAISFARWVSSAIPPTIVGDAVPKTLSDFTSISAGTLRLLVGGTSVDISSINLSGLADLTAVAASIQTRVRTNANPQLAQATVTYNTNTNQFVLAGTTAGSGSIIAAQIGSGQDVGLVTGLASLGATNVDGQAADEIDAAVNRSANISNNFGSFLIAGPLQTNANIAKVAAWNHAQNNMFMYLVGTSFANLAALFPLVRGYSGTALTILSQSVIDYSEQIPGEIAASIDFNSPNATQNFMFYQFANRATTVTSDNQADQADALRGNYIGVTQSAGQPLAFYQRGILCGGSQDAVDMNIFTNEMWLKSAFTRQLLALFLNMPTVPANETGEAMILAILQSVITLAKTNGVISAGKELDEIQKQYIGRLSNDPQAWRQVQSIGYWLAIRFEPYTNAQTLLKEYRAVYTLIYSKDDAIRKVEGSDVMI